MKEAEQRSRDFVRGKEAAALTETQRKKEGKDNAPWKREGIHRRVSYPHQGGRPGNGGTFGGWRREPPRTTPYARLTEEQKTVFTALVKTPCEILATEAVAKRFTPPTPGKNMVGPTDKYCEYHQGTGHNTNDCFQLKRKIEEAAQSGELAHQVKDIRTPTDRNNRRPKVNAIGRRNEQQRGQNRVSPDHLVFYPMMEGTGSEEALEIQGRIEEVPVERILIDTGAETDAIYEHYFWRLPPIMRRELRRMETDLEAFDGRKCKMIGKITLLVSIGYFPKSRTEEMTFYVIPGRSSVDMIMGRSGLRLFKAVPSTVHSILMLPTSRGVAIVPKTRRRKHWEEQEGESNEASHKVYMINGETQRGTTKKYNLLL